MKAFIILLIIFLPFNLLNAQQPQINLQPFASGLSSPLDLTHTDDNQLFVVQQRGLIRIIDENGNVNSTPFLDLTSKVNQSGSERGLLGLAFHPDYNNNGYFYVNYTRVSDGASVIARYSVTSNPDVADAGSEEILLIVDQPYTNHNGGDIKFGHDGYLYIALGDGGSGGDPDNYAQNRNSLLGKMLRIDVNSGSPYGIPADNPFVNNNNTRDEIWALGLRNHWRNSFDRYTGDLWIADVGQSAREEVNFQSAASAGGENYGWRCYEGNQPYNPGGCAAASEYVFPVFEYQHYGTGCTGSITGGFVYRGALYNGLFGKYITADYCKGDFYYVQQTDTGFISAPLATFTPFQYSSFGEDRYGELYVTLLGSGAVQKVTDTSDCRPVAKIMEGSPYLIYNDDSATLHAFFHPTLNYRWFKNGNLIPGQTSHLLKTDEGAYYSVEVTNPQNQCINVSDSIEVVKVPVGVINIPEKEIIIYPNPVNEKIFIDGLNSASLTEIIIYDVTGRKLLFLNSSDSERVMVDVQMLIPGVYFIKIKNGNNLLIERVLVRKGE